MTQTQEPTRLTDAQRELFDLFTENGTDGTALLSVIEKATGEQRAVVATVVRDADNGDYIMRPIALLLELPEDMDRFYPSVEVVPTQGEAS